MIRIASSIHFLLVPAISIRPTPSTSSIVIVAPVSSCIPWIIFPPGPIMAPMNSLGIVIVSMRGAWGFSSARGSAMHSVILSRMCIRPSLAWFNAFSRMSYDKPSTLISICVAVIPSRVPVTLKSISPKWSSSPRISDNTAYFSSPAFLINPIAIPETGFFIGTPASINAKVPAHTVAIEDEPFDSRISETTRTEYG